MSSEKHQNFDAFISETLNEFHGLSQEKNKDLIIPDFNNSMDGTIKSTDSTLFNKHSILAGAASIAIVLGLAIPALISWQGGSDVGSAREVKTTNNKQVTIPKKSDEEKYLETVTTLQPGKDNQTDGSTIDTKDKEVTLKTGKVEAPGTTAPKVTTPTTPTTTTTSTTLPQVLPAAPTGFYAYDSEKYPSYWKVKFTWQASNTPGVSYCVTASLAEIQNCVYNPSNTLTWQNLTTYVGDTNLHTYYIVAITPADVKSTVVSTSYAIPA